MISTLTAVILAKNEEEMIEDAIESVSFADKIIVIDNNSTDSTEVIAKKKGASVLHIDSQDFSELRSYPLKKITTDYIFYLDADERVSNELKEEILHLLRSSNDTAAFRVPRKNFYFGNHLWPKVEHLERLFKTDSIKGWHGKLHETADVKGSIENLTHPILHYSHRDLSSMVGKTNEWSNVEAKLRLDSHHPHITWWRFPRVMLTAFVDSYFHQGGYKAGTAGIVESIYQSFSIFITYAKLWEMQEEKKK
jgi:glycosyltransferase involved in cell wall biosynthesis